MLLEERLHEKAKELGEYFLKRLGELADRHRIIGEVRGLGLMIGVELVRDEKKTPAASEALRVREKNAGERLLDRSWGSLWMYSENRASSNDN